MWYINYHNSEYCLNNHYYFIIVIIIIIITMIKWYHTGEKQFLDEERNIFGRERKRENNCNKFCCIYNIYKQLFSIGGYSRKIQKSREILLIIIPSLFVRFLHNQSLRSPFFFNIQIFLSHTQTESTL